MANFSDMYSYTEENVKRYATLAAGVYRISYKKNDKYFVFYIGQSNNIQRRLLEHLSPSETDPCITRHLRDYVCFFRFIEISSLDERSRVEREQIKEYNPTCNS